MFFRIRRFVLPEMRGVARLLKEARAAGIRLAIATTTSPDNVTALLRASLAPDGDTWFEVIGKKSTLKQSDQGWRFTHLMP